MAIVAFVVTRPLRMPASARMAPADRRAELEAAKEAKYREIHDAELDHQMGKLSAADWRATDAELRREAAEILAQLDRLDAHDSLR